jgi:hypothetical protein
MFVPIPFPFIAASSSAILASKIRNSLDRIVNDTPSSAHTVDARIETQIDARVDARAQTRRKSVRLGHVQATTPYIPNLPTQRPVLSSSAYTAGQLVVGHRHSMDRRQSRRLSVSASILSAALDVVKGRGSEEDRTATGASVPASVPVPNHAPTSSSASTFRARTARGSVVGESGVGVGVGERDVSSAELMGRFNALRSKAGNVF